MGNRTDRRPSENEVYLGDRRFGSCRFDGRNESGSCESRRNPERPWTYQYGLRPLPPVSCIRHFFDHLPSVFHLATPKSARSFNLAEVARAPPPALDCRRLSDNMSRVEVG